VFKNLFNPKQKIVYQAYVRVSYAKSLHQDADKLAFINRAVHESHFKPSDTGQKNVQMNIVNFGEHIHSADALHRLQAMGLRRPDAQDLVALAHHQDLAIDKLLGEFKSERKILGLCVPWSDAKETDGDPLIPCLEGVMRTRRLRLVLFDYSWDSSDLFLGIRK
jgi:hypothetical protein